ncbi:MAG: hypothetical protein FJ098_03935 [Deltaproteobacteria bacterium]|nr:hypothetical protein [Deltaproteobacteria bacterium]
MLRLFACLSVAGAFLLILGCDSGGDGGSGEGTCDPGSEESQECPVDPGLSCTRRCLDDGSGWGPCEGCPDVHPCEGVTCSGHGTCGIFDGEAVCDCESGYVPSGLDCEPKICTPDCTGRDCGSDGCDGTCGVCDPDQECVEGLCSCVPDCAGWVCGADGCGGSCGDCAAGEVCEGGACVPCQPDCWGKQCGEDGCGGSCGTCPPGQACNGGTCGCAPQCHDKECGDDGCGGSCGSCPPGQACDGGECAACTPSCAGKQCGDNGCGGSCGSCPAGTTCASGQCISPGSSCVGHCGTQAPDGCWCDDSCLQAGDCCPDACDACPDLAGCGGETCGPGEVTDCWGGCASEWSLGDGWCDEAFNCATYQYDYGDCGGGGSSCQGICGSGGWDCYCDISCFEYGDCCPDICEHCASFPQCGCEPDCTGKACGDDGCWGSCGGCPPGYGCNPLFQCEEGLCESEDETPDCYGTCGPVDWIGDGVCDDGSWGYDFNCEAFGFDGGDCGPCLPSCEGKACGDDGCGGSCGACPAGQVCAGGLCSAPLDCLGLYGCLIGCGDDYACTNSCFDAGTAEAQDLLNAFGLCLETAGYFECLPDDDPCLDAAVALCQDEIQACLHGDLDCPGVTGCMVACAEDDPNCVPLCYWSGSIEAQAAYDAMIDCVTAACGEAPSEECWDQVMAAACQAETAACGVVPCVPACDGKVCGDDGCGGSCGACPGEMLCDNGLCTDCIPSCGEEQECGDDGCGGSCGECFPGLACVENLCSTVPGGFGWPCSVAGDCASTYCMDMGGVDLCTVECTELCPAGFTCQPLPAPATVSVCMLSTESV